MKPEDTIIVEQTDVACDGGGGALGHPKVYLILDADGTIGCPYCGRHFELKEGANPHSGH